METRKIVLHETGIIAIGECIGVAAMFAIFALLGRFDRSVVLGGLIGAVLTILNFFLMAVNANSAADKAVNQDVDTPLEQDDMIPLLFVRPTITIAEFFRKSGD